MFKEAERERRLEPGEEERLFRACSPQLRALVTAALETCCRVSELLKLQWKHVRFDLNEIRLPAANTKARRPRILPISTGLRALLELRRYNSAGRELGRDAFVLGNALGEPVASGRHRVAGRLPARGYRRVALPRLASRGRITFTWRAGCRSITCNGSSTMQTCRPRRGI